MLSESSSRWRKAQVVAITFVALALVLVDASIDRNGGCTGGFLSLLPDCHFTAAQLLVDLRSRFILGAIFLSLVAILAVLSRAFSRMIAEGSDHKADTVFRDLCDVFCGVAIAGAILNFIF